MLLAYTNGFARLTKALSVRKPILAFVFYDDKRLLIESEAYHNAFYRRDGLNIATKAVKLEIKRSLKLLVNCYALCCRSEITSPLPPPAAPLSKLDELHEI